MKQKILTLLLAFFTIAGYSQNKENLKFELPTLPDTLRTIEGRLNYVLKNYWCNFNFKDTAYIESKVTEEALVNYIDLLSRIPLEKSKIYLNDFLEKSSADVKMQNYMNAVLRRYLTNYDSPMRNTPLYVCAAEYLSKSALDEIVKYNAVQDISLLNLNPEGTVATDFIYTLPSGEEKRLSELEAEYTLLLFFSPDCRSCSQILKKVKASEIIDRKLEEGKLKLLAIYPQGDSFVWRNYIKETPDKWINGCDKDMTLITEGVYDLRVMPIFYLLNSEKKIILKDVPFSQVEEFLE